MASESYDSEEEECIRESEEEGMCPNCVQGFMFDMENTKKWKCEDCGHVPSVPTEKLNEVLIETLAEEMLLHLSQVEKKVKRISSYSSGEDVVRQIIDACKKSKRFDLEFIEQKCIDIVGLRKK